MLKSEGIERVIVYEAEKNNQKSMTKRREREQKEIEKRN